ncbi:hypothetical protein [Candidatus Tisiphia endosymbiont of Neophilaenus lineatus]|uniref:hypothetical protein n=1 Tax=Candidatus Tisiphia endosymbiont of Neophilaenus lineatus TaxID=3139336 RepID=UPI0035CB31E8
MIIKTGKFVPTLEKWLSQGDTLTKLDKALSWAERNKPKDNLQEIVEKIEHV